MAVDWTTIVKVEGRWKVQDINGEDWFDVENYLGIKHPGQLIHDLAHENRQLRKVLQAFRNDLARHPVVTSIRIADEILKEPPVETQP